MILSQESAHAAVQGVMGGIKLAMVLFTHINKVIFLDLVVLDPLLAFCPDVQVAGIYSW